MIAYLFRGVEGFSHFGAYYGTGNADGGFAWCGFRPKWVILKRSSNYAVVHDTVNVPINRNDSTGFWYPELNYAVSNGTYYLDFYSNGFKPRNSHAYWNGAGSWYFFAAFADNPFKYANAR
jgi:hypothetical protein